MEAPYTVATLPKPLDSERGAIHASAVAGISGARKRKRHEIAVGIDGEEVKIYNIQSQEVVTSYAIPPQAYICCAPRSVYVRRPKPARAQRRTYLVLRNGPQDKKRRLVYYAEERQHGAGISDTPSGPKKGETRLQESEVYGIDVVPNHVIDRDETPHVLVSYINGRVDCLSADLSKTIWTHDQNASGDGAVEYTGLTDIDTARKGLLAGREDILATLDTAADVSSLGLQIMCRVVCLGGKRTMQLYSLRPTAINSVQSLKPGMQHLADYTLPPAQGKKSDHAKFDVHVASGTLYQLLSGTLTVYDLSGTLPRILTSFGSVLDPISSFTRVSGSAVLAIQSGKAVVYETRYGAVFASVPVASGHSATGQKRKRDNQSAGSPPPWVSISYFQDSGLVAGLSGHELMAIQLPDDIRHAKRARSEGTLLVDVLGKGAVQDVSQPTGIAPRDAEKLQEWDGWKKYVDTAADSHDDATLERSLLAALKPADRRKKKHGIETRFEDVDLEQDVEALDTSRADRKRVLYILSKVFRTRPGADEEETQSGRLEAAVRSTKVFRLLTVAGFLSLPCIRQATALSGTIVQQGDLALALAGFDGTFELMHDLLGLRASWELPELVQSLRLLLLSLSTRPTGTATKALPVPPEMNGDVRMVNGDADSHVESESALAERELDMALAALSNGLELRSETLRLILDRLTAFPQPSITSTMRAMMKHEELFFFMKILRIELLEGGWHRKYVYTAADNDDDVLRDLAFERDGDSELRDQAISEIGLLMSCAIDAIGVSGWLVGQTADVEGTYDFMKELRNEVGASAEGLFEYDALTLFLGEVEKLEYGMEKAGQIGRVERRMKSAVKKGWEMKQEEKALPMGPYVDRGASKGGSKEGKSRGLLAAEARARVGKYVFERIRI